MSPSELYFDGVVENKDVEGRVVGYMIAVWLWLLRTFGVGTVFFRWYRF
jgi:hypothetical protein